MFEQIKEFFDKTNAKKVNISVNPNTNGTLSVVIGGVFPEGDVTKDNVEALNAKANLSQPLVVQGEAFEIESNIEKLISTLTERNKEQSNLFYSNIANAGSNSARSARNSEAEQSVNDENNEPVESTGSQQNTDEDGL